MLPKTERLKKNSAFQAVFRRGKPFFFQGVGCRVLSGQKETLIGFAVSSKTYPRAVDRNRVKRLLSTAVRAHLDRIPSGSHIVFFLAKCPDRLVYADLERRIGVMLGNMR